MKLDEHWLCDFNVTIPTSSVTNVDGTCVIQIDIHLY